MSFQNTTAKIYKNQQKNTDPGQEKAEMADPPTRVQ